MREGKRILFFKGRKRSEGQFGDGWLGTLLPLAPAIQRFSQSLRIQLSAKGGRERRGLACAPNSSIPSFPSSILVCVLSRLCVDWSPLLLHTLIHFPPVPPTLPIFGGCNELGGRFLRSTAVKTSLISCPINLANGIRIDSSEPSEKKTFILNRDGFKSSPFSSHFMHLPPLSPHLIICLTPPSSLQKSLFLAD